MSESSDIPNRVARLENDAIDIKVAVSALISTTEIHQRNIETMNRNMEIHQRNIDAMLQLRAHIEKVNDAPPKPNWYVNPGKSPQTVSSQ